MIAALGSGYTTPPSLSTAYLRLIRPHYHRQVASVRRGRPVLADCVEVIGLSPNDCFGAGGADVNCLCSVILGRT